jgi:hypothetical protein
MKHTPSLWHIIFGLLLVVTFAQPAACHTPVWDERLVPPGRVRRRYNHVGAVSAGPDVGPDGGDDVPR